MADMWSDYTDSVIRGIDKQISGNAKYKFSLRGLLTNPSKYAAQPNVQVTIANFKEEVGKYIDAKAGSMEAEKKEFDDSMARADAVTSDIEQRIGTHARQSGVPVMKPVMVDRDTTQDETLYVGSTEGDVEALIEKLVSGSMLIADSTAAYGDHRVGEWLFSGSKNYVLRVYLPPNGYFLLMTSRDELNGLLDAAADFVKGL